MTNIHQHKDQSPFLAGIENREWITTPGKATSIPVRLVNQEATTKIFHLSVKGIPAQWLEAWPEKVVVLPGEQKEIVFAIKPPDDPLTRTGRYPIQLTVVREGNGGEAVVIEGTLTIAAYEVQGRVAILMNATQFSVAPGSPVSVDFKLTNQGLEEDTFYLVVEDIPTAWLSTSTPSLTLKPGEQRSVSMMIQPPRHFQSRAGRHPFKLHIESQLSPSDSVFVECILTLEAFSDFNSLLKFKEVYVGQNIQMVIENTGNIPDSYAIAWASTNHNLAFEWVEDNLPENHLPNPKAGVTNVRIPPGETRVFHFQPKLLTGRNLFGVLTSPFRVNLTAANEVVHTHTGNVVSKGLIPVWVLQAGGLAFITMMCLASFFFFRGNFAASGATETALAEIVGLTQTVEFAASQVAGATQTASANMTHAVEAGQQDSDGDGLTNQQEAELGTDPLLGDTDGDGILDGAELIGTTNPLNPDTDGDGLTDGNEVLRGTDPLNPDTDADALSDGQEIQLGTDPLKPDTDSDGILDGNETLPCPDPLNPDSDSDGLIDGQDLDPCDSNNPSLTATAIAGIPIATPVPPLETPTEFPTDALTAVPTEIPPTAVAEPTATPEPQIPSLEGSLVLISTRDGNPEIYTLNLTDQSWARLTNDPAVEAQPSWSPDGSQIAFATDRDGNFEVYVMNADGTGLVNLTNQSSDDFDPAWSLDGAQIAFVSNRDGNNEIYVMNADGTAPFNASSNPANDSQPSWFVQNGIIPTVRIAFTSNRDGNQEIYSMNVSGIDQNNLSNNPAEDHSPTGLSDLGLIAFTSNRDGNQEIYVMSLDGSSQVNLTNNVADDWSPAWISTAEWVAFVSIRDGNQEIYLVNGAEQYNLTLNPADDFDPAWIR